MTLRSFILSERNTLEVTSSGRPECVFMLGSQYSPPMTRRLSRRGMRAADARKACPDITLVHVETISEGTEETPSQVWKPK